MAGFITKRTETETQSALVKAKNRNLVDDQTFSTINQKLERFHKLVNSYIKSIGPTDQA